MLVAHVDVDCFFAQVEEVRLGLHGRPLGVRQNMEVASVNYAARAFGLYNRILVRDAKALCPGLVLVRGDNGVNGMQRYRAASQAVLRCLMASLDTLACHDDRGAGSWVGRRVEKASFDDFYVLLPPAVADGASAVSWAETLRADVLATAGLRVSIGVARTKLLAMLATKRAKPDGVFRCGPNADAELELLGAARVGALRGAGVVGLKPSIRSKLAEALGEDATVGEAWSWLRGLRAAGPDAGDGAGTLNATEAEALAALLDARCDGSTVGEFALPKTLSVECSVRPTDTQPAVSLAQVRAGYGQLAPLLVARVVEDEATFGPRDIASLVVKWKLYPGAKQVRQAQVAWPAGSQGVGSSHAGGGEPRAAADTLASLATATFAAAVGGQPFRISRAVLTAVYAAGVGVSAATKSSAARSGGGQKRRNGRGHGPADAKQPKLSAASSDATDPDAFTDLDAYD